MTSMYAERTYAHREGGEGLQSLRFLRWVVEKTHGPHVEGEEAFAEYARAVTQADADASDGFAQGMLTPEVTRVGQALLEAWSTQGVKGYDPWDDGRWNRARKDADRTGHWVGYTPLGLRLRDGCYSHMAMPIGRVAFVERRPPKTKRGKPEVWIMSLDGDPYRVREPYELLVEQVRKPCWPRDDQFESAMAQEDRYYRMLDAIGDRVAEVHETHAGPKGRASTLNAWARLNTLAHRYRSACIWSTGLIGRGDPDLSVQAWVEHLDRTRPHWQGDPPKHRAFLDWRREQALWDPGVDGKEYRQYMKHAALLRTAETHFGPPGKADWESVEALALGGHKAAQEYLFTHIAEHRRRLPRIDDARSEG